MRSVRTMCFLVVLLACAAALVRANDSFSEVGAGGIRFLKRSDIILQKEVLTITTKKVDVAYRFFNPTRQDVTIEVAFPIPEYTYDPEYGTPQFDDFTVEADGARLSCQKLAKATLKGKDVTKEIEDAGLPVADLRSIGRKGADNPADHLAPQTRQRLEAAGLLTKDQDYGWIPLWTVSVVYHWQQRFPAGQITQVHHTYTPWSGGDYFYLASPEAWNAKAFASDCAPGPQELKKLFPPAKKQDDAVYRGWVQYILTTGSNWNGPIGDFTLTVPKSQKETVALCSDLPKATATPEKVEVNVKGYSPARDLRVYFLSSEPPPTFGHGGG